MCCVCSVCHIFPISNRLSRSRGYKTFFMLSSSETKIYLTHKFQNANNCWHFNIYEQDKLQALVILPHDFNLFGLLSIYEQFKFHAS